MLLLNENIMFIKHNINIKQKMILNLCIQIIRNNITIYIEKKQFKIKNI